MDIAVETNQLSKTYIKPQGWRRVSRNKPVTAVTDVTLTVEKGELFGLLGPNGAGKTTFVKMLCTLILPTGGSATVAGHPLSADRAIKAVTGLVVSDERSFYWRLSAWRNLQFFAALHGLYGRAADERIRAVLEEVNLLDVADQSFSSYSSGMKQRVAIARALLHQPQILFLDEPSRSLDPTATQRLHTLILELMAKRGMTAFLITHDLAEAEKLSDRVALMHKGQIRQIGRPADLRRTLQPQRKYVLTVGEMETAVRSQLIQKFPTITLADPASQPQINFSAGEADGLLTAVLDFLRQNEINVHTIDSEPPSLEEVFAHYTQDENVETPN